jgi:hypothetical protein
LFWKKKIGREAMPPWDGSMPGSTLVCGDIRIWHGGFSGSEEKNGVSRTENNVQC